MIYHTVAIIVIFNLSVVAFLLEAAYRRGLEDN